MAGASLKLDRLFVGRNTQRAVQCLLVQNCASDMRESLLNLSPFADKMIACQRIRRVAFGR